MALDHYVSRVHLKKFYSTNLGDLLYAIRKKDLKAFTPRAEDICRIEEGSTNAYLREDRIVEEFLKGIEPKYSASVEKLENDKIDSECIYTIAGFVAFVRSCAPAGMRIGSRLLQGAVEMEAAILDSKGLFPPPPPELAGMNLTEILKRGIAKVDVDPKFPQAIGISSLLKNLAMFGNFHWEILRNTIEDSPFFTSDYPVAIEAGRDPNMLNRIVPLSPNLAIRILPDRSIRGQQADYTFSNFSYRHRVLTRSEVAQVNRLIVRCAEDLVLFCENHHWVASFVKKSSRFGIDLRTHKQPQGTGMIMFYQEEVVEMPEQRGPGILE